MNIPLFKTSLNESLHLVRLLANSSLALLIFAGTIVPLCAPLIKLKWSTAFNKILLQEHIVIIILFLILFLIFGVYFIYFVIKKFYKTKLTNREFYIVLGLFFLVFLTLKLLYVFHYEQNFHSDFRTMWNYALETYHLGEFIPPDRPQSQRPLASLVPLVYLFGTSEAVFKLANIFFILSSGLMISIMVSKLISKHAAILVFIVIMSIPELYFASLIPTHDIAGAFYMVLYLFIVFIFVRRYSSMNKYIIIFYILLLSAVGLLLDIQRNIFIVLSFSLLFWSILLAINEKSYANIKKFLWISFLMVIIPYALEQMAVSYLKKHDILVSKQKISLFFKHSSMIRFAHSFSNGDYYKATEIWENYGESLKEEDMIYLKKALPLSDLYYNVNEKPLNYIERASRLYRLGSSAGFYYGRLNHISKDENDKIIKINAAWNIAFSIVFILLLLISSVYLLFNKGDKRKKIIFFPLIFMSTFTMALLLLGEVQPRYMFAGWFLWPIVIVWFLDNIFSTNEHDHADTHLLKWNAKGILIILIIVVLMYLLFKLAFSDSQYKLTDMSTWGKTECNQRIEKSCQKSIIHFKNTLDDKQFSTLKLHLPEYPKKDDYVKISKQFDVESKKKYILSLYTISPYFRENGKKGSFDVNIYIDDQLKRSFHISDSDKYRFIKIENIIPKNEKMKISFEIKSNIDHDTASWQKASLMKFKFISLRAVDQ